MCCLAIILRLRRLSGVGHDAPQYPTAKGSVYVIWGLFPRQLHGSYLTSFQSQLVASIHCTTKRLASHPSSAALARKLHPPARSPSDCLNPPTCRLSDGSRILFDSSVCPLPLVHPSWPVIHFAIQLLLVMAQAASSRS